MGKRARARRRNERRHEAAGRSAGRPAGASTRPERSVEEALAGRPQARALLAAAWDRGETVGSSFEPWIRRALGEAATRGWAGGELARIAGKRLDGHARALVAALDGPADTDADGSVVDGWRAGRRLAGLDAVVVCISVTRLLASLPNPPGGGARLAPATSTSGGADPSMLARVRALLAKAESTAFATEAEALTAKAHELMARHAIHRALVEQEGTGPGGVASMRIGIDDPYATAKVQLLQQVAAANGCSAVWSEGYSLVIVVGRQPDLEAVELLHTSLLVQATAAMLAVGGHQPGDRSRSRGFRHSFLIAYAEGIGRRLQEATASVVANATAEHGDSLLPVLASRQEAVDATVKELFPHLVTRGVSVSDAAGWRAGGAAADRADLGHRARVERGTDGPALPG